MTEETKKKISQSGKGRIFSEESKLKISRALKGKPKSKEHKLKLKNRVITDEWRQRKSESAKGKYGFNASNWQGGKVTLSKLIRNSLPYRQWRDDVFTRDDFICQICGIKGGELNADHIKPFSVILDEYNITTFEQALLCAELWNINNGRTLCRPCHLTTDTWGNKALKFKK